MAIAINQELCSGCGVCMEACSVGAIQLVEQCAEIDDALCTQCEACVDACPNGAIIAISEPAQSTPILALTATETQTNPTPTSAALSAAVPSNHGLARLAESTLAFLGREVAPRLVDALVTALERRLTTPATSMKTSFSASPERPARIGRGTRRQVRYRGGRAGNRKL